MRADRRARLALEARLVRMVLRASPTLHGELATLGARLHKDTRRDHSCAPNVRGLIAVGLSSIAVQSSLAVVFAGARVPRGRKRAGR